MEKKLLGRGVKISPESEVEIDAVLNSLVLEKN